MILHILGAQVLRPIWEFQKNQGPDIDPSGHPHEGLQCVEAAIQQLCL